MTSKPPAPARYGVTMPQAAVRADPKQKAMAAALRKKKPAPDPMALGSG